MNAAPVDEEAETTPGPDSVIAVLGLDQLTITRVGSMFDEVTTVAVVAGLNSTARTAAGLRARMLKLVVALDPEGAGADYGDGMADTVDAYADEVSGLREALSTDRLTPTAKAVLQAAIARSVAAQATVTAAFGGGE